MGTYLRRLNKHTRTRTHTLIHNYVDYINSMYKKTYLVPLFMCNVSEPLYKFIFADYNTRYQSNQSNVCCKHIVVLCIKASNLGRYSTGKHKTIWNDRNIALSSKNRLMHSLVMSLFLYACESWTLIADTEDTGHGNELPQKAPRHHLQRPHL